MKPELPIDLDPCAVTREEGGALRITWRSREAALEIGVALRSDDGEATHVASSTSAESEAFVREVPRSPRPYLSLTHADYRHRTVAERALRFDGVTNFRDTGGYLGRDGRRVRWGMLYRSGHMAETSAEDRAYLAHLGLDRIFDLRIPDEDSKSPSVLDPRESERIVALPLFPGSAHAYRDHLMAGSGSPEAMAEIMIAINRDLARDHRDEYAALLRGVTEAKGPVLVHCAAGKDRTGFGIALLLAALGVSREEIFEDYLLTRRFFDADQVVSNYQALYAERGAPPVEAAILRPLVDVRPDYLGAALAEAEQIAGSLDGYLRDALGFDEAAQQALCERLLE